MPKVSSTLRSDKNGPSQWICGFIGLSTRLKIYISSYTGNQEVKIWGIASQNITHHITMNQSGQPIYMANTILKLNHTVMQGWSNSVLKINHTVVQRCDNDVRTYRRTDGRTHKATNCNVDHMTGTTYGRLSHHP